MIAHDLIPHLPDLARSLARVRSQRVVVKVGGSIQDHPATMRALMGEVAALSLLGAHVCVVHGGGKAITAALASAGLASRFVGGQRYTDAATLQIAERVLALDVNQELTGYLGEWGAQGVGLHSLATCVLRARRVTAADPAQDLGLVGEVVDVDAAVLLGLMDSARVPVIAPVALDAAGMGQSESDGEGASAGGGKLNVNADLAAGAVADALKPDAFILVSDTPGVRVDATTYAPLLRRPQVEDLKRRGVIDGGMLPKVRAAEMALDAGVTTVAIVDGRSPGNILAALSGAGGERTGDPGPGTPGGTRLVA